MVVEIVYIVRYKAEEYEKIIIVEDGVDYAYFRALFDSLIDRGIDFKLRLHKESELK
jgi:hypothetical protein